MEEAAKTNQANPLSQLPKRPLITAPRRMVKSVVLDAVIVALAAVSGIFFASYLSGQADFVMPLVAIGAFMAFSVLGTLLTKNLAHRILVLALESLAFVLPFIGAPLELMGAGFAVMLVLLSWGEYFSREDAENSVEIRFFRIIKRPLGKLLTAVSIVGIIFYIPVWNKQTVFISRDTFDSIYEWSAKFAGRLYPEFRFDADLGTFAKSLAKGQLERVSNFSLLPVAIREKALNDLSDQIVGNLGKFFGFTLNSRDTFGDAMFAFANKSLGELKTKFGATFITLWAVAVFLFVRGLATFFGYFVSLLSFLIYHAFIAFEIIRVKTENKPHEIVEFF
jgi:hypothetical protein